MDAPLVTCPGCGLIQHLPAIPPGHEARCPRCRHRLADPARRRGNDLSLACALAGLLLYPWAIALPVMRLERFGWVHETSIIDGSLALLRHGDLVVGLVILLTSILIPAAKLVALIVLAVRLRLPSHHLALTYRLVEFAGRWGMVDVLLLAVLVAAMRLGDVMRVHLGIGALVFCACVLCSLAASAAFDAHALWRQQP